MLKRKTFKFTGKYIYSETAAASTNSLGLSPLNFDARCVSLSDQFMEFRFTKIKIQLYQAATGVVTIGYSPVVATVAPVTQQQVMDCQNSSAGPNGGVIGWPVPKLVLNRKDLMVNGPKWFRRGTAFDDLLEQQGVIYYYTPVPFNTSNMTVLITWELECAAPLAAADTATVAKPDLRFQSRLAEIRSEMKRHDEEQIQRIAKLDGHPVVQTSSPPGEDPVIEKLRDLLLRDGMVYVGKDL